MTLSTARYRLSADLADDYPASTQTTGVLSLGNSAAGMFEQAGDADWFKFHADAGQHYTFSVGGVQSSWLNLYSSTGQLQEASVSLFSPSRSGDYYIAATSYQTGAYSLTLTQLADDYSSDNSRPGLLADGGQASGVLEYTGDSDRFNMTMTAGHIYTISYAGAADEALTLGCLAPNGKDASVSAVRGPDGVAQLVVMPSVTGVYALNLQSYFTYASDISYTLSAQSVPDDYAATRADAAALPIGTQLAGAIQAQQDVDMFKVDLLAGVTYAFSLQPTVEQQYYVLSLGLSDSAGKSIASYDGGHQKLTSFTPSVSGSYYLAVGSQYGSGTSYTLSASLAPDDVGASAATAGAITAGTSVKGELEAGGGDRDWYGVAMDAGATYWFSLHGQYDGKGTLPTNFYGALLRVIDAKGAVLGSSVSDKVLLDQTPMLSFQAPAKGVYYVEVSTRDGAVGTYQLQAQVGLHDDFGNDASHAAALAPGVTLAGTLELPSDRDAFKFSAASGASYAFKLSTSIADMQNRSLSLTAVDSAGHAIRLDQVSTQGGDALYVLASPAAGDYTVSVNGEYPYNVFNRDYRLTALAYGADDYPAGLDTTAVLPVNGAWHAGIDFPGDRDVAKVHLDAGRTYVFELQGTLSGGGTLDLKGSGAGLYVTDRSWSSYGISSVALAGDEPRLSVTASAGGDYYVLVSANGVQGGSYTVVVTDSNADVTAPTVVSAAPGASNASLTAGIDLVFSESVMLGARSGITLKDSSGKALDLFGYGAVTKVAGHHILLHPANLLPGTSYTLEISPGGVLDLSGNKLAAPFSYTFTTVAAAGAGGSGNDYLLGTISGKTIDGGAGIDTVCYDHNLVRVQRAGAGYTVSDYNNPNVDTLVGVERILMPSSALALDIDGTGGQAYRLYQAAFNRTPDSGGLGYWISQMDHGQSLQSVAHDFVGSSEFSSTYGSNRSDAAFVDLLYHNVLHRAGDAGGAAYWQQALHDGALRESVLAAFSESQENQAALIGVIGNGFNYTPYG
jgi:hypothetical protein